MSTGQARGKYTDLCRQLWLEQQAQITQIHSGAASGDRRSQALLLQLPALQLKLEHIGELGKFVAEQEASHADRS